MDVVTYTTIHANLASAINRVCNDHEPLIITRNGEQSVVVLSLEDYKALEEIAYINEGWEDYLYSSNAFRKLHSIIGTF